MIVECAESVSEFCDAHMLRLDHTTLRLSLAQFDRSAASATDDNAQTTPSAGRADGIDGGGDDDASIQQVGAIEWIDGEVNWEALFQALSGRDTYSEDDYIPGAT